METTQEQASIKMMQFITGKWMSKPVYIAAKLCIVDILSDGPKTIGEIA